jgi:hypothetical protein
MDDRTVRLALERHWNASDASDFEVEHEIYREDAVLDYPQSGERLRGRRNIQESRFVQPNKKRFLLWMASAHGSRWGHFYWTSGHVHLNEKRPQPGNWLGPLFHFGRGGRRGESICSTSMRSHGRRLEQRPDVGATVTADAPASGITTTE